MFVHRDPVFVGFPLSMGSLEQVVAFLSIWPVFEFGVGRGEVIFSTALSRPRIVMLSPSSVFFSARVVVRAWVSSSYHSSCDNYNVHCRLALGGGVGSANVRHGVCAWGG